MSEEVVNNVRTEAQSCEIFCNWCLQTNTYTEKPGEYHAAINCAWCRQRLVVPRHKLRLNGHNPGVRR